ncbi:MAG: hypothetical protein JO073_04780, partial [Actinobacteria bacterium]|nr:hypothetical protein [Actinomycetota bacterium]
MNEGLTERLARRAAAHPKRMLAIWGIAVLAALALAATLLNGRLASNATVTGHPASAQAADLASEGFPGPHPTDVVVVRSATHAVTDPAYRAYVAALVAKMRATGHVFYAQSYLSGKAPVSADRHATLIQLGINSDGGAKPVVKAVQAANGGGFTAAITGDHSVGNDFNTVSQTDLEHGEFRIGLPAALVV